MFILCQRLFHNGKARDESVGQRRGVCVEIEYADSLDVEKSELWENAGKIVQ